MYHKMSSTCRSSLGNRLEEEEHDSLLTVRGSTLGSKEATFFLTKVRSVHFLTCSHVQNLYNRKSLQ